MTPLRAIYLYVTSIYKWHESFIHDAVHDCQITVIFLITHLTFHFLTETLYESEFHSRLDRDETWGAWGRSSEVKKFAALKPWGCWVPGWAKRSYWVLFAPTNWGEFLLFIFLGVKKPWFIFVLWFLNFLITVCYKYQRRDCEIGKSYISVSWNLLAMGTCRVLSSEGLSPFS